jgi:hypothetical protein
MSILDHYERQMSNLVEMMKRLGLDGADVGQRQLGMTLASAIRACQHCPAGQVCHDWLARASSTLPKPPPFCPNAERFAQLIADGAQRRPCATLH